MRTQRNKADYNLSDRSIESPATAKTIVAEADAIIAALDSAFSGANRQALINSLKNYARITNMPVP